MRFAAAALALFALAGAAEAAPKRATKPRGTFAAFIDPALVDRQPPKPKPLSIVFVVDCSQATETTSWLAMTRRSLVRELGHHMIDPIAMRVVIDCRSGNDGSDEGEHDCDASGETMAPAANANEMVIDRRCYSLQGMVAAIRIRIARPR